MNQRLELAVGKIVSSQSLSPHFQESAIGVRLGGSDLNATTAPQTAAPATPRSDILKP